MSIIEDATEIALLWINMQRKSSSNNLKLFNNPNELYNKLILIINVSESERTIKHELEVGFGVFIEDKKEWFATTYRNNAGTHDNFNQVDFYLDVIKESIQSCVSSEYAIRDPKIIFNYESTSSFNFTPYSCTVEEALKKFESAKSELLKITKDHEPKCVIF